MTLRNFRNAATFILTPDYVCTDRFRSSQCSWVFVGVSFLLTTSYSILCICYGVTLEDKYGLMAAVVSPIAFTSYVMAFMMKPKRTDVAYKRFLYFHFISFAVVAEVAAACGKFRLDLIFRGCICLFRIPLWCLAFRQGLKLREAAAKVRQQNIITIVHVLQIIVVQIANNNNDRSCPPRSCRSSCARPFWRRGQQQLDL